MQSSKIISRVEKLAYFHCQRRQVSNHFVPKHEPAQPGDVEKLENFLRDKQNVLVLTGAGISTESGKERADNNLIHFH